MLSKLAVVSLFILLIWGNLVAGLKAGLACPDWPLCHGTILPPFRWDIYMEFMHRVIGAITSIFIIALVIRRFRIYNGAFKIIPALSVVLLLVQIVLGGIVVLLELPVDLTTIHFGNAMIIFATVLYQAYYDGISHKPTLALEGSSTFFFIMSVVIFAQTVLGAYVRHSSAGLACPDFPTCLGQWVPPLISDTVITHFSHRLVAYTIFIIFAVLFLYSMVSGRLDYVKRNITFILLLIIVQIFLGAMVVLTHLSYDLTALHLSVAILIFSFTLHAFFKSSEKKAAL